MSALATTALALAPCLRDKFDFSSDDQYEKWAQLSFKAAKAFEKEAAAEAAAAAPKKEDKKP